MTAHVLILTAAVTATAAAPPQPRQQSAGPGVPTFAIVEGCVASESEIPGRAPTLVERAGLAEDYILTNAAMIKGEAPVEPPDRTGGIVSNALRPMYEIGGLAGEELEPHLGHRVRIEGTFTNTNRDPDAEPLNHDLVELTGTSIRQVPGSCAPKKS
jgi:hypothetical protein